MRKLVIILLAVALFTSCNNDQLSRKKEDRSADSRDKDKKDKKDKDKSRDEYEDDEDMDRDKDDLNDDDDDDRWSRSERNRFFNECENEARKNVSAARAEEYCNCVVKKAEKSYSSYNKANKAVNDFTEEELAEFVASCNEGH